jgi:hypothetical protein
MMDKPPGLWDKALSPRLETDFRGSRRLLQKQSQATSKLFPVPPFSAVA